MLSIRDRVAREDGGIIVLAAIVLPVLLALTAGGISGFSLYASTRELQRAADQAALAGAAALPPFDPKLLVEHAPVPLPDTDPIYQITGDAGLDVPRISELVPDPRSVACAFGSSELGAESALLTNAFDDTSLLEPPTGEDGAARETVCVDVRVYPRIQTVPDTSTAVDCTNALVRQVSEDTGVVLDPDTLPLPSPVQAAVDALVRMPLNHLLPAAFTPRMHVDVYSYVEPPLLDLVTDRIGGRLHSGATAHRRIKNAVVVPILPAQQLRIDLGLADPIEVITDPVNLNQALQTPQAPLLAAIDDADGRLDDLMATYGLPCKHLLHNLRQDLRDIYDPPAGPAPSALDIADAAVTAQRNAAGRIGASTPDPEDPSSLAGEAFYLIGIAVDENMQPVSALQVPVLDAALVVMDEVADDDYRAAVVSAANAYGAFRASLVR